MPTVETSVWIDAPIEKVLAVAKNNPAFPDFMKDVKSLEIVETNGNRIVTDWVGIVPKFFIKVKWRQEDIWDDEAKTCRFRQVKGDYDKMEGVWRFTEESGGTRFDSFLEYLYNVPTLGALVQRVIHSIVTENMQNVLEAIKARAESR